MRIDLYNSAAAAAATSQSTKTNNDLAHRASVAQSAPTEDTTSLTSTSDSVRTLTQTALQTIPSRADRVASLKQSVSSGQYQLDSAKIADALVNSNI